MVLRICSSSCLRLYQNHRPISLFIHPRILSQWKYYSSDPGKKDVTPTEQGTSKGGDDSSSSSSSTSSSSSSGSSSSSSSSGSSSSSSSSSSSDSSDSDNEAPPKTASASAESPDAKKQTKRQQAGAKKLEELLSSMVLTKNALLPKGKTLELASPVKTVERREAVARQREEVKKVLKLKEENKAIDPKIVDAVINVAAQLGGNVEKTKLELLSVLNEHASATEAGKKGDVNLDKVLTGIKIDRSQEQQQRNRSGAGYRRGDRLRLFDEDAKLPLDVKERAKAAESMRTAYVPTNLFGSGTLNIFVKSDLEVGDKTEYPKLATWDALQQKSLALLAKQTPANAFEEMILWTDQKKLWRFPIDNEQDMEEESKVGFEEHVFLEPLLEEGFPKAGPIRHFMELVTTGLSKNPYITVQEKHDHVDWFRNYFGGKRELLEKLGVA